MRMADFLSKSPRMSVTVHSSYDALQGEGDKVEWNDIREVTLSRPDRLRINTQRSDGARSLLVFDGKEITTFDESSKTYAQASHPGSVDDAVIYFVRDLGMRLPLAVLLMSRLPAELEQRVQSVEYVEKTATLSAPAHHIAGRTATVDFQLWIAEGDRPMPLRAVLTYKEAPGQPQFRAQFSDWNFDGQVPESAFMFKPPERKRFPLPPRCRGWRSPRKERKSGKEGNNETHNLFGELRRWNRRRIARPGRPQPTRGRRPWGSCGWILSREPGGRRRIFVRARASGRRPGEPPAIRVRCPGKPGTDRDRNAGEP
jgi:hypothetical protein